MKQLIIFSVFSIVLFSCGSDSEENIGQDGTSEEMNQGSINYPEGEKVYLKSCVACHQDNGTGLVGAFPPLAGSDYLFADKDRAIRQIISGSNEKMEVNGAIYESSMPPQNLTDDEVKDVMNYILNQWGNQGGEVTIEQVAKVRAGL